MLKNTSLVSQVIYDYDKGWRQLNKIKRSTGAFPSVPKKIRTKRAPLSYSSIFVADEDG